MPHKKLSHFLNDMEKLVGETQEESTRLVDASDEMQGNIKLTTDLFDKMMEDFRQNINAFQLILSSVNALQMQHEETTLKIEQITQLSDKIQSQMKVTNDEAEQANKLAQATRVGLKQFVD
ncbi:hypothetical protein KUL42_40580 [Alteromonas sp. KUL42]|uniref:hypothetical protein n=1 Tax=Alteromonas sp. KUL42 TaxID=2480797 RepID=UPI0010361C18|nr:hypothetical protein [Alteromonas sp. KUL42]TAP31611.1 hypothetical protein EYR97_20075 [Alteromonas sp. KUL42]GEA09297.1 hypothetical protein KUL42_40580 [Alteromonas sp. KUL42]